MICRGISGQQFEGEQIAKSAVDWKQPAKNACGEKWAVKGSALQHLTREELRHSCQPLISKQTVIETKNRLGELTAETVALGDSVGVLRVDLDSHSHIQSAVHVAIAGDAVCS